MRALSVCRLFHHICPMYSSPRASVSASTAHPPNTAATARGPPSTNGVWAKHLGVRVPSTSPTQLCLYLLGALQFM